MPIDISINVDRDFQLWLDHLRTKYGEEFEYLNGLHSSQMDTTQFIDNFIDKNVADATIDSNANAHYKDICSLLAEENKSLMKLLCFSKLFYELKKKYGLQTAREWFEAEWGPSFYMHDASSSTLKSYCGRGDTRILTDNGIHRLDELVGQNIRVLNRYGYWEDAVVHNFGKQELRKIVVERYGVQKELFFTGEHRWFVRGPNNNLVITTTDELKPGMKIPHVSGGFRPTLQPSPFGVAHGFFIGDGDKSNHMGANFCGDKIALLPYFTPANVSGTEKEYTTRGIPKYFKELPPLNENPSYLYGWLSGYFAADGCVDERGVCTIASVKIELLQYVQQVLCVLGLSSGDIRFQDRITNFSNGENSRIYILTFPNGSLPENFFIRPLHKDRISAYLSRKTYKRDRNWNVVSVTNTGIVEDVYCPVVPRSESFVLEGGILTHNCFNYSLKRLAEEGLYFLSDYNNEPPKHLTTFLDDVVEYVSYASNRTSGAFGMGELLVWAFYFWKQDIDNEYYIKSPTYYAKQNFQKIIYRLNQPFLRIDQSSYSAINLA